MLRLTPRISDAVPIEAGAIAPDRLAAVSPEQLPRTLLQHGNREVPLGDLFDLEGSASDGCVEIDGDCSRLKNLGQRMAGGSLIIRGSAGMHLGAEMTGGRITVHGDVSDWLGAEMTGGLVRVHGRAGHLVGAAYRGGTKGMRGGAILIDGDAGDEVGASMRRGLIAVGGVCGAMAGISMIAGSVIAFGGIGRRPGAGMKRGSIVVMQGALDLPRTFRDSGSFEPLFLQLYFRQLREWGFAPVDVKRGRLFRRFIGDLLALGKGEILQAVRPN